MGSSTKVTRSVGALRVSALLASLLGALALSATPALAAAPEAPRVDAVTEVTASKALLNGVLYPGAEQGSFEMGPYEFVYRKSASECEGAGEVKTAEGLALGEAKQPVSQEITGLSPNSAYTACLIAYNEAKTEHSKSSPLTFTTAPEAPETRSPAKAITTTGATFEGVLNPKATAKAGWYFAYKAESEPPCTGAGTTPAHAEAEVKAAKVEAKATGLEPGKKYLFCLVATNAGGAQATAGNEVAFKTVAVPPQVLAGSETAEYGASEATLHAEINPNNLETSYAFEYATEASGETLNGTIETVPGEAPIPSEQYGPQGVTVSTGAVLHADLTYYYRVTAENSKGEKAKGEVERFQTPFETPEAQSPEPLTPSSATLKGVLDPSATAAGEAGTYEFRYRQSAGECEGGHLGEEKAAPVPAGTALGHGGEVVGAPVSGLLSGTQYSFCLLARDSSGQVATSSVVTFTTPGAGISEEQATDIEAGAVSLQADIFPNGSETTYHFEYDTTPYTSATPHGTSVAEDGAEQEAIGSGAGALLRAVSLRGLQPATTYYYRVVATNEAGTFYGAGESFTTPSTTTSEGCQNAQRRGEQPFGRSLPDCRADEMVSPLATNGQDATEAYVESRPRASLTGEAVTYASKGVFAEPLGATVEDQYLSSRDAEKDEWTTRAITPEHDPTKTATKASYDAAVFTPELTEAIINTNAPLINEEGSPAVFRLYRADFEDGSYQFVGESPEDEVSYPEGTTPDLSHVVFGEGSLFEWANGAVTKVDVANDGAQLSASVGAVPTTSLGQDAWHAVSANGSRVYFTTPATEQTQESEGPGQLYERVNVEQEQSAMDGEQCASLSEACTLDVSASRRAIADPHGPQPPRYWGASADGSKVFFTSKQELTEDAYTGPKDNAPNLYEYEIPTKAGTPGRLTDLTVADGEADGAAVQGVAQISEDGSYVYFVADGVLAHGPNVEGKEATAGQPNLYVIHEGGEAKFIATLESDDSPVWQGRIYPGESGPEVNSAVLTPSGSRLAFVSSASLTGYDNQEAEHGQCEREINLATHVEESGRCDEVFLYEAGTGHVACASCNPTGARPIGPASLGPILNEHPFAEYRPRNLLEDGRLFFDSSDAITAHGSDGHENVYEYEDGRVYAISDPAGGHPSFFLDASAKGFNPEETEEGANVFFATADQLVAQDKGENVVVYDARIDGGFPAPSEATTCTSGETCKPPAAPQPPLFGPPSSQSFTGPGDTATLEPGVAAPKKTAAQIRAEELTKALKACHKDKRKKRRQACERSARARYGAKKPKKKAKKASNDRRASR